jgi:hypothetical protein
MPDIHALHSGRFALCCVVLAMSAAVVLAGAESAPPTANKGTSGAGRCPLSVQQLSRNAPVKSVTAVKRACKGDPLTAVATTCMGVGDTQQHPQPYQLTRQQSTSDVCSEWLEALLSRHMEGACLPANTQHQGLQCCFLVSQNEL